LDAIDPNTTPGKTRASRDFRVLPWPASNAFAALNAIESFGCRDANAPGAVVSIQNVAVQQVDFAIERERQGYLCTLLQVEIPSSQQDPVRINLLEPSLLAIEIATEAAFESDFIISGTLK
jgi:hypothetical protein